MKFIPTNLKLKILLKILRIFRRKSKCSFYKICSLPDDQGRIHYQKEGVVCNNYVESDRRYCGIWRTLKETKNGKNKK